MMLGGSLYKKTIICTRLWDKNARKIVSLHQK